MIRAARLIALLVLLLVAGTTTAQPPAGGLDASIQAGPIACYRLATDNFLLFNPKYTGTVYGDSIRGANSGPGIGWRAQGTFNYIFLNGWFGGGLGLGFREHEYFQHLDPRGVYPAGRAINPATLRPPDSTQRIAFNYLDLSVFAHFQLPYARWQPFVKVGLTPAVLLGWEMRAGNGANTENRTDEYLTGRFNRWHLNAMLQPGIRYWFLNNWAVSLELPILFDFLPAMWGPTRDWQYSAGINLGIKLHLPHVVPNGP